MGKQPQVILAMYFFILDKNNKRPDWITDLKHTDSAWFRKLLRSIVYKYRILTSPAFQPYKYFCSTARTSILLSELKVKMLLFFKYNYILKRKTAINVFFGSYRKGKYRTFNIETEPSYAETHPKTPTPT